MRNILNKLELGQGQATQRISILKKYELGVLATAEAEVARIEKLISGVDDEYMKEHQFVVAEIRQGNSTTGDRFLDYTLVSTPISSLRETGKVRERTNVLTKLDSNLKRGSGKLVLFKSLFPNNACNNRFCVGVLADGLRFDLKEKECWINVGGKCITIAFGVEYSCGTGIPTHEPPQIHPHNILIDGYRREKDKNMPDELGYFVHFLSSVTGKLASSSIMIGDAVVWKALNAFLRAHASTEYQEIGRQIASDLGVKYLLP